MLCSECSRPILPVVAVDLDGTLGDYHTHFLDFAAGYLGYDVRDVPVDEGYQYHGQREFKEWFLSFSPITEDIWYDIKLAYRQGAMKRTMPVYASAAYLTERARGLGAELWITTSRPYNRLDNIDPDSQAWLQRNQIAYDHMIYDDDKYQKLSELVSPERVVAVLDDLPEMYDAAERLFGRGVPILRTTKWNRAAIQHRTFIPSLKEASKMIENNILSWVKANG